MPFNEHDRSRLARAESLLNTNEQNAVQRHKEVMRALQFIGGLIGITLNEVQQDAQEARVREEQLMGLAETLKAKTDEALAAIADETNAVTAVGATVDHVVSIVADLRTQLGDTVPPEALAALDTAIANVRSNKDALVAAALRGTAADPAPPSA